jgi:hypothetical protein
MFRNYGWPPQSYGTDPDQLILNNQQVPRDIVSANWQKRSNVVGVLENRLPFEFANSAEEPGNIDCYECEILIDEKNNVLYEKVAIPEVPVTEGVAEATTTASLSQARTGQTARSAPVQTGAPRHRQHVRHQDFHNHGRDI